LAPHIPASRKASRNRDSLESNIDGLERNSGDEQWLLVTNFIVVVGGWQLMVF
jgi:hypothetical protein